MNKYAVIMIGAMLIAVAFTFQYMYNKKPAVVSSWATENETTHVLSDKVWEVGFTEEMDEQTINENTVYVTNSKGEKLDLSVKLSKDKKTIVIDPPKDGYDSKVDFYTLYVKSDLKSASGRDLKASKNISFTVSEELPVLNSKEQLQAYFKSILKREKESMKLMDKFGFSGGGTEESADMAMDKSSVEGEAQKSSSNEFTDTNVQVQGVDEADSVKTDGTYIYQVIDRKLKITKAVPATNIETVATVSYQSFDPFQLFIDGNKLVVMGYSFNEFQNNTASTKEKMLPMYQQTKVIVYDITDKSKPKETKIVNIEGNYVTSRKIGSTVYLINNYYPDLWMMEERKDIDLRPRFTDSAISEEPQFIDYKDIRYFPESREATYSIIATFDIEKPQDEVTISTYLGSGQNIYMSKENLYIAVTKYSNFDEGDNTSDTAFGFNATDTEVFKFAVNGLDVEFLAAGSVPGRLLNQFSMDERKGYFRIATTEGEAWNERNPSANSLYVLDQQMKTVGGVEDLARGERIYSVRFMGDKAYIVTFKETDPLFVLDISDPTNPTVLGELKIPGFSNYLQPYDENHLIGFGQNTKLVKDKGDREPRVQTDGVKISMFDVTDPLNPKEKFTEIIGGSGTYSPLNYDHKALLFNKKKNIFAFPITIYEDKPGSQYEQLFKFQGAVAYSIDMENGFELEQQITHEKQEVQYESWERQIFRVLNIEDHIYAVSPEKITAQRVDW